MHRRRLPECGGTMRRTATVPPDQDAGPMRKSADIAARDAISPHVNVEAFRFSRRMSGKPSGFAWFGIAGTHSPMRSQYHFDSRNSRDH